MVLNKRQHKGIFEKVTSEAPEELCFSWEGTWECPGDLAKQNVLHPHGRGLRGCVPTRLPGASTPLRSRARISQSICYHFSPSFAQCDFGAFPACSFLCLLLTHSQCLPLRTGLVARNRRKVRMRETLFKDLV